MYVTWYPHRLPELTFCQDLEQIEEWNEYGELKEQIAAVSDMGVPTTSTPSSNLAAEPPQGRPTASTNSSGPPSRASSETRHILISDPKDKETGESGPAPASQKPTEPPLNVAMRQLGAEAAAKAGQKKAASAQSAKAPIKPPDNTEQTPVPATTKLSPDAAVESPETATEVTAAKTPAQLAAEGAKKTSIDKIAETEGAAATTTDTADSSSSPSTEAQLVEQRRQSSITKQKSRLSESTPADQSESVLVEEDEDKKKPSSAEEQAAAVPTSEVSADPPVDMPKQHRGSDIGIASPEEIRAIEKETSIPESGEEHDAPTVTTTEDKAVTSTDEVEGQATKGKQPQEEGAKDADKAGVSVGD